MSENLSQVTHRLATKESIDSLIAALQAHSEALGDASQENAEALALVQEAIEELPNATKEAADEATEAADDARAAIAALGNLAYGATGLKINAIVTEKTKNGVTWTWDPGAGMYHAVGESTGDSIYEIFYEHSSLPDGMSAGKRYRVTARQKGEDIGALFQVYKEVGGNLTLLSHIAIKSDYNDRIWYLDVPADAGGMMIRYKIPAGETVNHYFSAEITEDPDMSLDQIKKLIENQTVGFFGILKDSEHAAPDQYTETNSHVWESCDDVDRPCIGFVSTSSSEKTIQDFPYDAGWLITLHNPNMNTHAVGMQIAIDYSSNARVLRYKKNSTWGEWKNPNNHAFEVLRQNVMSSDNPVSADDMTECGIYFSSFSGNSGGITGMPFAGGWLWVIHTDTSTEMMLQIAFPYSASDNVVYRIRNVSGVWGGWRVLGSGDGTSTIENTYNITCSPSITTDDHNWLEAVDTESSDETGKTDMTAQIMAILEETGHCHLSPGIFYVSGNIDMPEGAVLEGCGDKTIIRLLASVTTGYCVRVGRYNTVKGIRFSGAYSAGLPSSVSLGTRNAIICIANADGHETEQPSVEPNIIEGCWFDGFTGSALYQHNTGGGIRGVITMSNCFIRRCGAGINIDYYSEYCKYSNIITEQCYYACINNGGNNIFTACTFHGTIGFLMDNADDKRNDAHGSCIGCTFNHIDNWNHPADAGGGDAVKVISNMNGFIFSGCQIWYGAIKIQNSRGMTFANCLFGGGSPVIRVEGAYGVFLHGCTFQNAPSLNVNAKTKLTGCYLASDSSQVST